ncbi:MAG: NAD(P)-binding protein [Candidatus Aminicenantes bacterium]|nr:NAD(P)-binding protein [Candidatus Aminicenantes bacterium]
MNNKKVIIIGAGISGLCAGSYLQMNGYNTEIFELHNRPGGLCTAWERKGYTFDLCIHWLVGSSPSDNFYGLWNELIEMEKLDFVDHEIFFQVEDKEGRKLRMFTDVDKLEEEMKNVAPEDKDIIEDFIGGVRKFLPFNMPLDKAREVMNPLDGLKMMFKMFPYFGAFKKWGDMSANELANRCKNPLLKRAILEIFLPETTVFFLFYTLVTMHKKSAGYPIGGSLNFARLIEKKYISLGGKVNYNSRVERVIEEGDWARGIRLENGDTHLADIIISAADGYSTIFKMLDGKYVDEKLREYYSGQSEKLKVFPSLVFVALGVAGKFDDEPQTLIFPLKKPIVVDESVNYEYLTVRIFNFDPTLAPEGKTSITVNLGTYNYEYWVELRKNDKEKYRKEKERIANEVIEALEERLGNIKSNIEVTDVSTPASLIRFTNNWKGSFEGWHPRRGTMMIRINKTLPGLSNFYMIGQWVEPGGGLPPAIMSGRSVAQIICKKDGKKFTILSS